jgi:hypothetical protein
MGKTINVSDELYALLDAAATRTQKPDIPAFLNEIAEIQAQKRLMADSHRMAAERKQIQELEAHPVGDCLLWQKFASAMDRMFRIATASRKLISSSIHLPTPIASLRPGVGKSRRLAPARK